MKWNEWTYDKEEVIITNMKKNKTKNMIVWFLLIIFQRNVLEYKDHELKVEFCHVFFIKKKFYS